MDMWSSIASWFTPNVLFCVLNLMIGTILLSSNFKTHNRKPEEDNQHYHSPPAPGPLYRAPSLLERVRSINFNSYISAFPDSSEPETQQSAPLFRAPSLLQRVTSINLNPYKSEFSRFSSEPETNQTVPLVRAPSLLERVRSINFNNFKSESPSPPITQTNQTDPIRQAEDTDTRARTSKLDRNRRARLRKSASEKRKVEEANDFSRLGPMTVRERHPTPMLGGDEAVDAKADDFINKFKTQLKLQRLDSYIKYKEMLHRGASR